MRTLLRSCLMLFIMGVATLHAQPASSDAGDRAVREVIAQYMTARNEKNVEAIRSLFTPDADQLVSTGEWRRGLNELTRGMMASSQKETGKSSIAIENIRFLDPNIAIADGRYQTTSVNRAVRDMWTTFVLKRTNAGWRIAAIRNMLPAPAAR
jgi:uncharacterized protein (TIGR02246 family)